MLLVVLPYFCNCRLRSLCGLWLSGRLVWQRSAVALDHVSPVEAVVAGQIAGSRLWRSVPCRSRRVGLVLLFACLVRSGCLRYVFLVVLWDCFLAVAWKASRVQVCWESCSCRWNTAKAFRGTSFLVEQVLVHLAEDRLVRLLL